MKIKFYVITLILLMSSSVYAQKKRIAVMDFKINNVSRFFSRAITDFVCTEIFKKGDLIMIERSRLNAIMGERNIKKIQCLDSSCAVEVGKLLSAHKIITGTISKIGTVFSITARVIDVGSGRVDFMDSERCAKEDDLESASRILAIKLLNRITGKSYTIPSRTYRTEEERNHFAIGGAYRYGIIRGLKVPYMTINGLTAHETNCTAKILVVTPSYEFNNFLTFKANLKYYSMKYNGVDEVWGEKGSYGANSSETDYGYFLEPEKFKGTGFTCNIQLNYRIGGFIPFLSTGIGISRFEFQGEYVNTLYYDMTTYDGGGAFEAGVREFLYMKVGKSTAIITEFELGISVYVSKYVEIVLVGGVEYPIGASLFDDLTLTKKSTIKGVSTAIDEEDRSLKEENNPDNFDGNFPPMFFAQAGVNFRIF